MRIVMAEDALLEARARTRVASLAENCAPWETVPPTWYANPSYTRCPIGAEPDEDPDSAESWVRQLASEPVDDTAANALLDQALAGIDANALSPHNEEAAEVARQVMEALTRCGYFWCAAVRMMGAPSVRGITGDNAYHTRRGCAKRGCKTHILRHAARRSQRCASRSRLMAGPTSGPLSYGTGVATAGPRFRFVCRRAGWR